MLKAHARGRLFQRAPTTTESPIATVRYLVLPLRPEGTEQWNEEQLAALVTRDAMIGVITVQPSAKNSHELN